MKKNYFLSAFLFLLFVLVTGLSYLQFTNKETKKEIFDNKQNIPVSQNKPDTKVRLMLVGDIMLGRSVNVTSLDLGNVNYPFEKVAEKLKRADIVFANLESPLVNDCPRIESGYTFCADPGMADGLVFSGIDVVSLANNHNLNFGKKGFEDTKKILAKKGIKWVGDQTAQAGGNLEIIEKNGIKFGFLGFDFVTDTAPGKEVFDIISESDPKVDVLIVGVHWGNEYKAVNNNHQKEWAIKIIAAGADIISGHHPHWVQNDDKINGIPVYYSLGNFVFDQMWSEETKKGLAVELTFDNGKIVSEEKYKTYIRHKGQPEWVAN